MAKKDNRFPYEIRRNKVAGIIENIITSEKGTELARVKGEVCKTDQLAHNVHLLTVTGNKDDYFIVLFEEDAYVYSKDMKYKISFEEEEITLEDRGETSVIKYKVPKSVIKYKS